MIQFLFVAPRVASGKDCGARLVFVTSGPARVPKQRRARRNEDRSDAGPDFGQLAVIGAVQAHVPVIVDVAH